MAIPAQYQEISVEGLPALSERMQKEGHRFVQVLAVNTEAGIDVQYTFMKDGVLEVFTIKGVTPEIPIPSITDRFIAAFVFENEIHDLFGVNVRNIAIDFGGNFYATAQPTPMTIISPAQKAAREKAKKAAAAKAEGTTRAVASMRRAAAEHPNAVFAVGNAPTALLTIAEEIENGLRPALVIGVPVGFVNVVESKERLFAVCESHGVPAIVAMGRKGGSNVAAAICNALIYSAAEMLDPTARGWK